MGKLSEFIKKRTQTIILEAPSQTIWDVTFSDTNGVRAKVKIMIASKEDAIQVARRHLVSEGVPEEKIVSCTATVQPHCGGAILATSIWAYTVRE